MVKKTKRNVRWMMNECRDCVPIYTYLAEEISLLNE